MDDIAKKNNPQKISPSVKFPHEESISRLENALSIDDEEAQCYKENFATIRKLLVGSPDFAIAVSPQGDTIIKIGDIPFIMDDIVLHDYDHTIKTWWHQYYQLNRLKQNYEKELPSYEEWMQAKESCGSVDALISIINGAGNGFISKNTTTNTTKTYASWFAFHPFQWEDIYGQYICKRFANNTTKFVPIHGENFVSCKRVYRGDMSSLSFRPLSDKDILWYTAKDGVLDVCYTTEQYSKTLNDKIYEAYLRHKPFEDFYTNLTISSPELQNEFMTNLFLVMLSQYSPYENHISEVITYAKKYFATFNIPTEDSEKFFKNIFSRQIGFVERFSKILWLNNKTFSLLKERISDLQDEYPEYDFKELIWEKNISDGGDYYDKKNKSLWDKKKLLPREPYAMNHRSQYSWRYGRTFPYIYDHILSASNPRYIYEFIDTEGKSIMPYLKIVFDNNKNTAVISRQELKCLDMRCLQIYASMSAMWNRDIDPYATFDLVTNDNELLIDKYSIGKILLPTDELPDIAYLPSQDDMLGFYDKLKTISTSPWKMLIEIIMKTADTLLAEPKNIFDLGEIYIPCKQWGIVISQEEWIKKVEKKPEKINPLVVLIKNIVPSHGETTTRVDIKKRVDTLQHQKKSIKRYQLASKKSSKKEQEDILTVLRTHTRQEKEIQYNPQLSWEFGRKEEYTTTEKLPFITAEQILANLDIYKTTNRKRSMEYTRLLMQAWYTTKVLENLQFFDEYTVCSILPEVKVWDTVLPLVKKFTSSDHQKEIIDIAFFDIDSKIANFIEYFPDWMLSHRQVLAIIKNPEYKDIDRSKYRNLCNKFLDGDDILYIKTLPVDEIIKVLPIVENIASFWLSFLTDCIKKENKIIPFVFERLSDFTYENTDIHGLRLLIKELKEYYKEDSMLAKKIRTGKDIQFIRKVLSTSIFEQLDQSFLLDILQRTVDFHQPFPNINKNLLNTFVGPLSMSIVNILVEQWNMEVIMKYPDKFVALPDTFFSNDWVDQMIEKIWIDLFSGNIKHFHDLDEKVALQIHNSANPKKYEILYTNKEKFKSFPKWILGKEDAQTCLDTYGLATYSENAHFFDEVPMKWLQDIYLNLYKEKKRDDIVKNIDFFVSFIPSWVYRSLQRHGYIEIWDPVVEKLTQQNQVRKYFAPQEIESMIMASVIQTQLPSEGKYIDATKRWGKDTSENISIDDVIEEYDPLCMPFDYFYHDEDKTLKIWDKNVHIVKRTRENGSSFGFDTIYLVDDTKMEQVYVKKVADSISTQKYITIKSCSIQGDKITIDLSTGKYQELFEPITEMRNAIKEIIKNGEEEKFAKTFTRLQKSIATDILLEQIKEERDFTWISATRLIALLEKWGGDRSDFLKNIYKDTSYCRKNPDIVFRAIETAGKLDTFTKEESQWLISILLHTIDWKKYPKYPISKENTHKIFINSWEIGNDLIDKLIEIYTADFLNFAKDFGDNQKLIRRCMNNNIIPKWFSLLVYREDNYVWARYFIQNRKDTLFQDIIRDIQENALPESSARKVLEFYKKAIREDNYTDQVKWSMFLEILNQDDGISSIVDKKYVADFITDGSSINTTQMIRYLYKAWLLNKIKIEKMKPELLKDIVMFLATCEVPSSELQKITQEMMQCIRDTSVAYPYNKDDIASSLRVLLNLNPDIYEYFKGYAQSQNYDINKFVSTIYVRPK